MAPITLSRTTIQTRIIITTTTTTTKTVTEPRESQKLFTYFVRHVATQTVPQRIAKTQPMQPKDRLPGKKTGKTESGPRKSQPK